MKAKHRISFVLLVCICLIAARQGLSDPEDTGTDYGLRPAITEKLVHAFPEKARELNRRFGIVPYAEADGPMPDATGCHVLLVHGLDDPGKVWMNLAPALSSRGFDVWLATYPNDQPVRKSAVFLYNRIKMTPELTASPLVVVAHSMGGLVARQMLTAPELSYATAVSSHKVPAIKHLILVATPNHGSSLAHLRVFTELRELFMLAFKGEYHWLLPFIDGAGEAGVDLLPDSEFLKTLNSRKTPPDVRMTVIAGVMTPGQARDTRRQMTDASRQLPEDHQEAFDKIMTQVEALADHIGDGAVSVQSATLEDIPLIRLKGNHLSVIRNILSESDRIPPAVPVILELVQKDCPGQP